MNRSCDFLQYMFPFFFCIYLAHLNNIKIIRCSIVIVYSQTSISHGKRSTISTRSKQLSISTPFRYSSCKIINNNKILIFVLVLFNLLPFFEIDSYCLIGLSVTWNTNTDRFFEPPPILIVAQYLLQSVIRSSIDNEGKCSGVVLYSKLNKVKRKFV